MNYVYQDALVNTCWLEQHINSTNLKIVDATYFLPNDKRNAFEKFSDRHIPGSIFFNIDEICNKEVNLPHMLPRPEDFSLQVGKLGIGTDDKVIVYDSLGGFMAACRVWWMFRVFGHEDVAVLNGGLPKWINEKRPTTTSKVEPREQFFSSKINSCLVKSMSQIVKNIDKKEFQIIDARSPRRFSGVEPEPRPTKKSGHIPNSINLPFTNLLNPEKHYTFKSAKEIRAAFKEVGVDVNGSITSSCGSGVTAAVLSLALYLIGNKKTAIYDGSWAEWGDQPDARIVT